VNPRLVGSTPSPILLGSRVGSIPTRMWAGTRSATLIRLVFSACLPKLATPLQLALVQPLVLSHRVFRCHWRLASECWQAVW